MRKHFVILAAVCLAVGSVSCGGTKQESVPYEQTQSPVQQEETVSEEPDPEAPAEELSTDAGKYLLYEYEAGGQVMGQELLAEAGMGDTYLELKPDGSGKLNLFTELLDITWKPGTVTVYGTTDYPYTLDGDKLTLDMQGVKYTMLREGADVPEAEASDEAASVDEEQAAQAENGNASEGDGIVSEEAVQKGYVWLQEVNKDVFNTTYEDLAAYFGVEGSFDKEEYSEHMQENRRYYKWISNEDPTHFLYVNFGEKEPGVYKITGYNTSGFSGPDAVETYLEELEGEARAENIAGAADVKMKDFSVKIHPWGEEKDLITLKMQIPESGWAYDEAKKHLVENEDINVFGAGFIQFELKADIADFDFYKDKFENYKDIEPRVIGGIEMQGRTYKNIGYDWTEYIGTIDDAHAISIGIVDVDVTEGTVGDKILNSIKLGK